MLSLVARTHVSELQWQGALYINPAVGFELAHRAAGAGQSRSELDPRHPFFEERRRDYLRDGGGEAGVWP